MGPRKRLVLVFLLLSIAALAQQIPDFNVTYPFHFMVYGDTRFTDSTHRDASDPDFRRAIVGQVAKEKPDFLVLTGDLVGTGSSDADWQVLDHETEVWRQAGIHVFPVLGNHDTSGASQYFSRFPDVRNRPWYAVRTGNCYFIMLNSNVNSPDSQQWKWLVQQLENVPQGVQYLFVVQHHPALTRSSDRMPGGGHSVRPVDERLASLLEERQKQLKIPVIVLAGHVHNYERYLRDGVMYVTTGGGGATPHEIPRDPADPYPSPGPTYSYCRVTVDRNSLAFQMVKVSIAEGKPSFTVADSFQFGQGRAKAGAASH